MSRSPLPRALWRLEAAVAAGERALIVALVGLMAGAVFLDALHRLFAADEGRLGALLVALLPAGAAAATRAIVAPALLALGTFGIGYGALRTRSPQGSRRRALALAALGTAGLAGATQLLVKGLPAGLVWSQSLALCFMLWVGLAGASLGTREHAHIAFELAGKLWPRRLQRPVEYLARAVAAGFALFLAVLAAAHTREHYLEWQSSQGAAGLIEALALPRWAVFAFLPLSFSIMGLRFLAFGVRPPEGEERSPS